MTLNATTVLDLMRQGTDEDDEPGETTDRNYWLQRSAPATVEFVDDLLTLVNEVSAGYSLKYTKFYIGLANQSGMPDNFVAFKPRKEFVAMHFRIPKSEDVTSLIDEAGFDALPYETRSGRYRIRLTRADLNRHRDVLLDLIRRANGSPDAEVED
jgi:hypothetical protein